MSCLRVSFNPFRLPNTVTAIDSVLKNSFRHGCEIVCRDCLDSFNQLIEREEVIEIHFLARQVRHAGGRGFERQHQAALQLVF